MTAIADKVAVVTGGASGIGRGTAESLIARGATVVIADIQAEVAQATAAEIGAIGLGVDVSDADDVAHLAESVLERLGRIDIVVNNAGVGPQGKIQDLSLDDWRWMLSVNLFGVINGIHTFLPLLQRNVEGGHIVNTASMSAFTPLKLLGAYAASKAAVAALSEVLSAELLADDSRVKVTLLTPGSVHTGIATSMRSRPNADGALKDVDLAAGEQPAGRRWLMPREVGDIVARAIENDDFYAITHPELWPRVEARNQIIHDAFTKYGL
jgi:NAD(P)-dependent dehydrogenase (short-subunit alcohol dehydrogenase family)